jgi:hypothetical protein
MRDLKFSAVGKMQHKRSEAPAHSSLDLLRIHNASLSPIPAIGKTDRPGNV